MAEGENKKGSLGPADERFKYIGFDVFPGKAGDIFNSEEERKTLIEKVKSKLSRSQGEVRDRCTLMETRVSMVEKLFLTAAAVFMVLALFVPWFSGYIPVSYTELGSFGDNSFYFASNDDSRAIDDLSGALKKAHSRRFAAFIASQAHRESMPEQPVEEIVRPGDSLAEANAQATVGDVEAPAGKIDEGINTAALQNDQAPQAQPPVEEAEPVNVVPEEIKVIFVNDPDLDQVHGIRDLEKRVVAVYTYNARNDRENLVYGTDKAMSILPQDMIMKAETNDSISIAVTDSMKQAIVARMAKGDSTITPDSVFYAGPVLVDNKAVAELAQKGVVNDYYSVTGIGALLSLGTYSSKIFSSGIVLVITGILMIVYFLSCLVLAAINIYLLYGAKKGSSEEFVLYLKKMLRFNWIPVIIWLGMFILSFVGASYGFDPSGMLQQVGDSYGIGAFIGLSSFGIYITLAAFLIVALKGKEI